MLIKVIAIILIWILATPLTATFITLADKLPSGKEYGLLSEIKMLSVYLLLSYLGAAFMIAACVLTAGVLVYGVPL